MKTYTDLEQSKKLAEILPIESADMWYCPYPNDVDWYDEPRIGKAELLLNQLPCWSLAALLELIPESIDDNTDDFSQLQLTKKSVAYYYGDGALRCGFLKDNFINAAFEMIVWLKENGKI